MSPPPRRILLSKPDSYGDLILFEPVLRQLVEVLPDSEVWVLARAALADAAPLFPARVRWLFADLPHYAQGPDACASPLTALLERVASLEPDVLVSACISKPWLDPFLARALPRARQVTLGPFSHGLVPTLNLERRFGLELVTQFLEEVDIQPAEPDWLNNQRLVPVLAGVPARFQPPRLNIPADADAAASAWLAAAGLPGEGCLACCPAGTANVAIKSWAPEGFAEVLTEAHRLTGLPVLILVHEREAGVADAVRNHLPPTIPCATWSGRKGDFALLAALIARASLYIGNDTGPLHAAQALGRPAVALFGGGTWPRFAPAGRALTVVQPVPCFGCGWQCHFGDAPCLATIPGERVSEILRAHLPGLLAGGTGGTHEVRALSDDVVRVIAAVHERYGRVISGQPHEGRFLLWHHVVDIWGHLERGGRDRQDLVERVRGQQRELDALRAELAATATRIAQLEADAAASAAEGERRAEQLRLVTTERDRLAEERANLLADAERLRRLQATRRFRLAAALLCLHRGP